METENNVLPNDLFAPLAEWTALDGPSGFEEPVLAAAKSRFAACCEEVSLDMRGNLYALRRGTSPDAPRTMILTHADEVGVQVTSLEPAWFLRFTRIGGTSAAALPGTRIRLLAPAGPVPAVIGLRPGHLPKADGGLPPVDQMYLDIGVGSPEEAARLGVEPGTPGVFDAPLVRMAGGRRVCGKAIDNRAGLLAQVLLADQAKRTPYPGDVVFVVTVEEEVGLRGAMVAARPPLPFKDLQAVDVVLAIDTVPAGGTPDVAEREIPWGIGGGPLIKVRETKGLVTHGPLRRHFLAVARARKIPVQLVVDGAGVTDAASAQQADRGIAALTIGLARRYSHSAVEIADLSDLADLIELVSSGLYALKDRSMLRRIPQ